MARYLDYLDHVPDAVAAFVMTNSVCQGQQASEIWPAALKRDAEIRFAHVPFKWNNLASHNAGVTVIIVGMGLASNRPKKIFDGDLVRECGVIGPYLVPNVNAVVQKMSRPIGQQSKMLFGNMPRDGGHLFLSIKEANELKANPTSMPFVKKFVGSEELINGKQRYCLWIEDDEVESAQSVKAISNRLELVSKNRRESRAQSTQDFADRPHRFVQIAGKSKEHTIVVPRVSSENRDFLPVDYLTSEFVIGDRNFALYGSTVEHGTYCLATTLGLDRNGMRPYAHRFFLFKHSWLEYLSGALPNKKQ